MAPTQGDAPDLAQRPILVQAGGEAQQPRLLAAAFTRIPATSLGSLFGIDAGQRFGKEELLALGIENDSQSDIGSTAMGDDKSKEISIDLGWHQGIRMANNEEVLPSAAGFKLLVDRCCRLQEGKFWRLWETWDPVHTTPAQRQQTDHQDAPGPATVTDTRLWNSLKGNFGFDFDSETGDDGKPRGHEFGWSAAHEACSKGRLALNRRFWESTYDCDVTDLKRFSRGAGLSVRCAAGNSLLHVAARSGHFEALTRNKLFSRVVSTIDSAWSIEYGVVRFLLSQKQARGSAAGSKWEASDLAVSSWDVNFDVGLQLMQVNMNGRNGWTPLIWAAITGCEEVASLLIQAGCDIFVRDEKGMMWAAKHGHEELDLSVDVDEVAKLLLQAGEQTGRKDDKGWQAADHAKNHAAMLTLLEASARLNQRLHLGFEKEGAQANHTDDEGWSALLWATGLNEDHVAVGGKELLLQILQIPRYGASTRVLEDCAWKVDNTQPREAESGQLLEESGWHVSEVLRVADGANVPKSQARLLLSAARADWNGVRQAHRSPEWWLGKARLYRKGTSVVANKAAKDHQARFPAYVAKEQLAHEQLNRVLLSLTCRGECTGSIKPSHRYFLGFQLWPKRHRADAGAAKGRSCEPGCSCLGKVNVELFGGTQQVPSSHYSDAGWTALHFAVSGGFVEVVSLLHHAKGSLDAKTFEGDSLLHMAVQGDDASMIQLLLASSSQASDAATETAAAAAQRGCAKALHTLLMYKADPQASDQIGNSLLHLAAIKGHASVIRLLMKPFPALEKLRHEHALECRLAGVEYEDAADAASVISESPSADAASDGGASTSSKSSRCRGAKLPREPSARRDRTLL
ncbi:unnamed protein product [Symbiodinium natans]|uniref:Uncharacterized protein n=1 Tax=Symbiodinium natans TaxID=878477 RepID=A0A812KPN4_9DINO|nr:unnamed protein product [Symbiodinium natans]